MLSSFFHGVAVYFVIFIAVIILIFMIPVFKRKKAARIAAEQQRARQEEARRREEAERREQEAAERRRQAERELKERETDEAVRRCPGSEKYRLSSLQTDAEIKTLSITEFTPVSKKRYVAFDLETTGLSYMDNQIVEIGAVLVENGEVVSEYHQMVNPGCRMPSEASAVNHITDDMLTGQPKIHQVLPAFLSFVGDDVLVAHNAAFDIRFLCQACMINKFRTPAACFDTMNLARYWPEAADKKLTSLTAAAGIQNDEAHRALSDARSVAALVSATNQRRADSRKKSKES